MIKNNLIKKCKKIDKFLINFLNRQDKSLLIQPMKYGVISGGKNKICGYNERRKNI